MLPSLTEYSLLNQGLALDNNSIDNIMEGLQESKVAFPWKFFLL